jgi:hypothetical protein
VFAAPLHRHLPLPHPPYVQHRVAQAYSHKHDFDNDAKSTKRLALGVLKKQVTEPRAEIGVEMAKNPIIRKKDEEMKAVDVDSPSTQEQVNAAAAAGNV